MAISFEKRHGSKMSGEAPQQAQNGRLSANRFSEVTFDFKTRPKIFLKPALGFLKVFFAPQKRFFRMTLLKQNRRFLIRQPPHLRAVSGARLGPANRAPDRCLALLITMLLKWRIWQ
jgi:hypothetical protein